MADLAVRAAEPAVETPRKPSWLRRAATWLRSANVVIVTLGAFLIGLTVGALLIIVTTPALLHSWGSVFAHPGGTLAATWNTVWGAYEEIFVGSIFDPRNLWHAFQDPTKANWSTALNPISETLTYATPLILAGLGIAIGFRTSLFDIGGAGQLIAGAICATWVGITFHFAGPIQITLELVAGIIGGAIIAGIAGVLKAYSGAHEVITTMMLNKIMALVLAYLLIRQPFAPPGVLNGQSRNINPTGMLPHLLGFVDPTLRVNFGLVIALAAAVGAWWLLNRSTLGFNFQAVGLNAEAARNAGVNAKTITVLALTIAGALVGLAGMTQVTGVDGFMQNSYGGTIGFDGITVALLGRNRPVGVVLGAILFGALQAGGHYMQANSATNIDYSLAQVIQAVIVFCVATPAIVIEVFRLKDAGAFSSVVKTQGWGK